MKCQFPRAGTVDVNAACERRVFGLLVFPTRGDSVGQQGDSVCEPQASDLIKLNLSPSSTLCVFGQYRIDGGISPDHTRLRKDQEGVFDEALLLEGGIIGPKVSLDIDQLLLKFHPVSP
jgi:hypothetical protein